MKRRRVAAILLAVLALGASGCGSRLPHAEVVAASDGRRVDASRSSQVGTTDASEVGAAGEAEASPVGEGSPTGEAAANRAAGAANARGAGERNQQAATEQAAVASGNRSPILIGSVGNYSGPPGTAQAPGPRAVQVWVNHMNRRGGVAGHPIQYVVVDDGSDPARHRSAVQDLVENRGVVAFVGQFATQTDTAAREYLEKKNVPVIGGVGQSFFKSPMFFPNFPPTPDVVFGSMKNAVRFSQRTRLATLTCVEAEICDEYKASAARYAAQAGVRVVYQADVSVAQPDFTAECLSARNAGADLVMPVGDQNTIRRVVDSCNRQGFRPTLVNVLPDETAEGLPAFEGSVSGTQYFPFTGVAGNNPTREYRDAFEAIAPKEPHNTITAAGWTAAKLFEKAVTVRIGAARPTTQGLLDGLWTMRDETLGGLSVPLTFAKGRPAVAAPCWFTLRLTGGKWVTPDGLKPSCR